MSRLSGMRAKTSKTGTQKQKDTCVMKKNTGKIRSSAIRTILMVGATLLTLDAATAQDSEVESSFGVDVTNQYFFRGIIQENEKSILQPWVDFVFPLSAGESTSWSLNIGVWNSLHDGLSGSGSAGMSNHYELDAYLGIGVDFAKNWSGSVSYVALTSPNSAFGTVKELDFSLSFDDSGMFGGESSSFTGFQPSVTLAWELDGQSDGGAEEGIYLEVGIEPAFESQTISVSFPIVAGFGISNYFEGAMGNDDFFGFAQGGVSLSTPLNFIPARMGSWSLSGGASILLLGDILETINGGDNSEVILSLGLGISL